MLNDLKSNQPAQKAGANSLSTRPTPPTQANVAPFVPYAKRPKPTAWPACNRHGRLPSLKEI